jgi:hypothetical protein
MKNLFKVMSLTLILALSMPVVMKAQGKANFAGSWEINAEKSPQPQGGGQGGGGFRMGASTFKVTQDANLLTQTSAGRDGAERITKYTLDGKVSENVMFGDNTSKSTATWSADGKSLTIVTKMDFNGQDMTTTTVWTLVDDKTLSITTNRPGPDGDMKTTMVYNKK